MTATDYFKQFSDPDPRFGPVPAWWWSGDKLDWDRMRWQMDQMFAMGIRNLVIINLAPGGTLFASEPDDPPFLSDEWWGYFRKTCDYAAEKGMKILFYDQIGFSGANFQADIVAANPAFSAEQLRRVSVEGTGELSIDCPGAGEPLAAYVVEGASVRYVDIADRRAVATASSNAKLLLVYTVRQGFDFLSADACQTMLDTVHRQFEKRLPDHIGRTIIGSFQDELPEVPTWGRDFAASFEREYGYDLTKVVHRLFEQGDDASRLTRVHYHAHRATRAEHAFFKPFFDWHESHGMACGFDQQSPAREARVLGCTLKYADYMRVHQWYGMPGCDLHGNGKLHSSIAHLHDRKRVWLEGFHSTGWGGTIADTFDWLLPYLRAGSNLYNPHAIYYSTKMGWWEWAPPSTCWRQPYAMHYPAFVDMVARLTKVLTQGTHQATVGVLFPTTTVQSAIGPLDTFDDAKQADITLHETIGSMRWHQEKIGPLDEIGVDYHVLSDGAIASATLIDSSLDVADAPLRAIVLPYITMIDASAFERLRAFAKQGGTIIAIGAARVTTTAGETIEWSSIGTVVEHADEIKKLLSDCERPYRAVTPSPMYSWERDGVRATRERPSPQPSPGVPGEGARPLQLMHRRLSANTDLLFIPAITGMATVVKWPGWFERMEHTTIVPGRYATTLTLQMPGEASVTRFDPIDGTTTPVATHDSRVEIDFAGAPFVLLAIERGGRSPAPIASSTPSPVAIGDEWAMTCVPTLPSEHIDTHDPQRPELRLPHTTEFAWEMTNADRSTGLVDAEPVLAGFGVRGWTTSAGGTHRPIVYSPEFGIAQDRLHINTLGPKGHVLEEFIDLGKITPDEPGVVNVAMQSDEARDVVLLVGSAAIKSARLNGEQVGTCTDRYQWTTSPLHLAAGRNELQLTLAVEKEQNVRLWWCLVDPTRASECIRPERIVSHDTPVFGGKLVYSRSFTCPHPTSSGKIKVSVAALAKVFIDGRLIGRQGGCDPYRPMMRGNIYDLPALSAGAHSIEIELLDPGSRAPMMVDLLATDDAGRRVVVISDETWLVSRDAAAPAPVMIQTRPEPENAAWGLYRRPHPLPQTRWIEGPSSGAVLEIPLAPPLSESRQQWLEWTIPPGATAMSIKLAEHLSASLWIDGEPHDTPSPGTPGEGRGEGSSRVALTPSLSREYTGEGANAGSWHVALPGGPARRAILRVLSRQIGGGLLEAPIAYELGEGRLRTGSWLGQGLRSYSGAVRMRQTIALDGTQHTLDLGQVRGTVEARLNGESVGVRFMAPYRFDLSSARRTGENELELIVTNTLVNHLSTWSPSRWWSPDQLECGVLGPVTVW